MVNRPTRTFPRDTEKHGFSDESARDIPEVGYPRLYSLEGAVAYLASKATAGPLGKSKSGG